MKISKRSFLIEFGAFYHFFLLLLLIIIIIFIYVCKYLFIKIGFLYVALAGLETCYIDQPGLKHRDPPYSASRVLALSVCCQAQIYY